MAAASGEFGPTRLAEDLARRAESLEQQAQRYQQLEGRMKAMSVTETSSSKRVTVTVDSNGVMTGISLAPSARGADPAALSAEIMSSLGRAQAKLRGQVAEVVREVVGDDGPGAMIIAQYAERFPEDDDVPPAPTPPPLPTPPAPTPPPAEQASAPAPPSRKPDRDRVVTPDEPDDDEEFYRRKSWLI